MSNYSLAPFFTIISRLSSLAGDGHVLPLNTGDTHYPPWTTLFSTNLIESNIVTWYTTCWIINILFVNLTRYAYTIDLLLADFLILFLFFVIFFFFYIHFFLFFFLIYSIIILSPVLSDHFQIYTWYARKIWIVDRRRVYTRTTFNNWVSKARDNHSLVFDHSFYHCHFVIFILNPAIVLKFL